jgi:NADH dehydrogenase [ubiquinone] 1 alpha subcomplex assembly factor 7
VTPLMAHLRARIAAEGPLGVDAYMAEVLAHPKYGYYMSGDPLGRAGDFVTAPEVSQMFGELIGLWSAVVWSQMGRPPRLNLVEIGPGRGTLMVDALRAMAQVDGIFGTLDVHMVETSPSLTLRQKRNLSLCERRVTWHETFSAVPGGPLIVIANEYLDALPIRQFVKTRTGWGERKVGVAGDALAWIDEPTLAAPAIDARAGEIVEVSPARDRAIAEIAERVAANGGAALLVDYGHGLSAPGDSLQAIRAHQYHDVLADPGEADVTSHVDFAAAARSGRAAGAVVHGPVTQGDFLRALGIETRAQVLARGKTPREAGEVFGALKRLTGAKEMGDLFKVLALTAPGLPQPAGFGG